LASFGKLYISNPDLAERIVENQEINPQIDFTTLFRAMDGSNLLEKGYTDYPTFSQWKQSANLQ